MATSDKDNGGAFNFELIRMEDDDTFGLFKIWLMDDFRVNGIWKKDSKIGINSGYRLMVFWKNDEPIIDAEDDGCGAVTILVFNNLKILTIKYVVEMLKITQAA
ncbi:hypothetical protein AB3S75_037546 [Citrus x aurantiifolia]